MLFGPPRTPWTDSGGKSSSQGPDPGEPVYICIYIIYIYIYIYIYLVQKKTLTAFVWGVFKTYPRRRFYRLFRVFLACSLPCFYIVFIVFLSFFCVYWLLAAVWLASWLAGWVAAWLASWLAGWLADWLAGLTLDPKPIFLAKLKIIVFFVLCLSFF